MSEGLTVDMIGWMRDNEARLRQTETKEVPLSDISCRVTNNAAQTIANNTLTALAFNTERWDTASLHDNAVNNSRITFGTAGKYLIIGQVEWAAAAGGRRQIAIRLNGTTILAAIEPDIAPAGVAALIQNITTEYLFAAGDYVELRVFQTSGGNLNVTSQGNWSPEFSAQYLP